MQDLDRFDRRRFAGAHGGELILARCHAGAFAIDLLPAGLYQHATFGLEGVLHIAIRNPREACGLLKLGGGIKHRDEALHDHVVNLLLGVAELGKISGRDDGKVVGNFFVVEHALELGELRSVFIATIEHRFGITRGVEIAAGDLSKRLAHIGKVVFGQIARIGTRIGDDLVLLVKRLRDAQRAFGGEARFALQSSEVVELRRDLRLRFFLFAHAAGLALAARLDRLGNCLIPNSLGFPVRVGVGFFPLLVDPFAEVVAGLHAEGRVDFEVGARLECLDLGLAGGEDCKRWRLHAAGGGDVESAMARVETGQRAGRVEADEPVGFRAALCGIGEGHHLLFIAQFVPRLGDRVLRHRLHPQTLHRFLNATVLDDVAEDQLTLAAGVAGVDQEVDVLALGELEHLLEARLGIGLGFELEVFRDRRQHTKIPRQVFAIWSGGHLELDQVADGGGDDRLVILEVGIAGGAMLFKFAERLGQRAAEVGHDAGFFGDDEYFSHGDCKRCCECGLRD